MTDQAPRSLSEEAVLLLDAVAVRLAQAREKVGSAEPAPVCPDCGRPTDGCSSCPWCRLQTALRQQRPEVTVALIDAVSAAVTAVRAVLPDPAARRAPAEPGPAGGAAPQKIPIQ